MTLETDLSETMTILLRRGSSLRELAAVSRFPIFDFYKGASLTGVDLSYQDLRGLNFDGADLRGCNLERILFDTGAFNNSILSEKYESLADNFQYSMDDVLRFPAEEILVFVSFRGGIIDNCLDTMRESYRAFAGRAIVSENSLRKARNSKVVSIETAQAIIKQLKADFDNSEYYELSTIISMIRQPTAMLLVGGNNGPFIPINPESLERLLAIRHYRIALQTERRSNPNPVFRDTYEYLIFWEDLMNRDSTLGVPPPIGY